MGLIPNDWHGVPLFERAKQHIITVDTVLDIGPGLRPQSLVDCRNRQISVEPHWEYADVLEADGREVIRDSAPHALQLIKAVDTVTMLDVIEHMEKADGLETILRAIHLAKRQVIVFTPMGFLEQSGGEDADAWGMQGQFWQKHRSGWTPDEFPGWIILSDVNAFFAIWSWV